MPQTTIDYTETDTKGRYTATRDDVLGEGELTFSKASPKLIIAEHTMVPESMRGMGVARLLAERLISDARTKGQRIVPLCPFVRAHSMKRRDALADVIQW